MPQHSTGLQSFGPGESIIGPFVVDGACGRLRVSVARCTSVAPSIWTDEATQVEISARAIFADGGSVGLGATTSRGGVVVGYGAELSHTTLDTWFAYPQPIQFVEVVLVVSGPALVTEVVTTIGGA